MSFCTMQICTWVVPDAQMARPARRSHPLKRRLPLAPQGLTESQHKEDMPTDCFRCGKDCACDTAFVYRKLNGVVGVLNLGTIAPFPEGSVTNREDAFVRIADYEDDGKVHDALLAYAMPGETYGYKRATKEVWSYSDLSDATIVAVANALDLDELPPPRAGVRHVPDADFPNDYVNVVRV